MLTPEITVCWLIYPHPSSTLQPKWSHYNLNLFTASSALNSSMVPHCFLTPHYRFSASLRYHIPFFHRTFVQIISSEWSALSYDHPTQITGMIYLPEINLIPALPQGSLFQTKSIFLSYAHTCVPFFLSFIRVVILHLFWSPWPPWSPKGSYPNVLVCVMFPGFEVYLYLPPTRL